VGGDQEVTPDAVLLLNTQLVHALAAAAPCGNPEELVATRML
jgi:hypothetical protein